MQGNIFSPEYIVSNLFALLLVVLAIWRPFIAKVVLAVMFIGASVVNAYIAITNPASYLGFADVAALQSYERFILGYFSRYVTVIVLGIAVLQLLAGVFMATRRPAAPIALFGAAIFLLAIAPLGAGSAFPSSVLAAVACLILMFKETADINTFVAGATRLARRHKRTH